MSTNTIFIFGIILVILGTIVLAEGCSCEDKSSIFIGLISFAFGIIMIVIAYQGYSFVDRKLKKVNNSEITERKLDFSYLDEEWEKHCCVYKKTGYK